MKEILVDELKQIQINMLKEVHDFCILHDIKYSLTYGTLIGAIRHSGYIPWDDDIDIFMTRPNYDKFMKIFRHDYIVAADIKTDSNCNVTFGKLYDNRTKIIEDVSEKWNYGVYMDLFVIDGLGDDFEKAVYHYKKMTLLRKIRDFKIVKVRDSRSFIKNIVLVFGKIILFPIDYQCIQNYIVKLKHKYNYFDSKYAADLCWGSYKRIMPKEVFETYTTHPFEGHDFMVIENYDTYLRSIFGDYMQLPPEEKRVSHHAFKAWWKE